MLHNMTDIYTYRSDKRQMCGTRMQVKNGKLFK